MNGRDKGLLSYQQQPLVERVLAQLRAQIDRIVIVANRNLEHYRRFGVPVISDWDDLEQTSKDHSPTKQSLVYQGPMRGIYRAQCYYQTLATPPQWLLVAPCDAPHYPRNLLQRYQEILAQIDPAVQCLIPNDGTRLQPLFALLRQDTRLSLQQALAAGQFSLMRWLQQTRYHAIAMPAQDFQNINSPEQLED